MSKIFDFDARTGSLIDRVEKTVGSPTGTGYQGFKRTDKGLAVRIGQGDHSYILFEQNFDLSQDWTMVVCAKMVDYDTMNFDGIVVFGQDFTPTYQDGIVLTPGRLLWQDSGGNITSSTFNNDFEKNKWRHFIATYNASTKEVYAYHDNVVDTTSPDSTTDLLKSGQTHIAIGCENIGTRQFNGFVSKVEMYDHIFTPKEREKSYEDFLNSHTQIKELYPKYGLWNKPTWDNSPNLAAAYNMIPNGNTLVDISGNGYNGTINGAVSKCNGMEFDGADDILLDSALSLSKEHTICLRYNPKDTGGAAAILGDNDSSNNFFFWTGTTNIVRIMINGNSYNFAPDSAHPDQIQSVVLSRNNRVLNLYVDGVLFDTVTIDSGDNIDWDMIDVIGSRNGGLNYEGDIYDLKIYTGAKDEDFAKDYHNQFAKRVVLKESFENDGVGTNVPTGWVPHRTSYSGDQELKEFASQDSVLKHLDVSVKYLEFSDDGNLLLPTEASYGTWEFDVYHPTETVSFFLISENSIGNENGYHINLDDEIKFIRRDGSSPTVLAESDSGYLDDNTWYSIKVTRTLDGEFTIYIKGGSFGNSWILADMDTNPFTDNTHTTSNYIMINGSGMFEGQCYANIKITEGVEQ